MKRQRKEWVSAISLVLETLQKRVEMSWVVWITRVMGANRLEIVGCTVINGMTEGNGVTVAIGLENGGIGGVTMMITGHIDTVHKIETVNGQGVHQGTGIGTGDIDHEATKNRGVKSGLDDQKGSGATPQIHQGAELTLGTDTMITEDEMAQANRARY